MKAIWKWFVVMIVFVMLAGCSMPASVATPVSNSPVNVPATPDFRIDALATSQAQQAEILAGLATKIAELPAKVEAPVAEAPAKSADALVPVEDAQVYDYKGLPLCDKPDESTPLSGAVQNDKDLWEIKIQEVSGCNLIFEGRIVPGERLHRIIVLRSANGENTEFVKNGVFTYAEGSIWQKPRLKNIDDMVNLVDPAEAAKLLNDKRKVMQANGYDWPIWVHFVDSQLVKFAPGETWDGLSLLSHCVLTEPVEIDIHGEKIAGKNQFAAAIGATDCKTVAWIDGAKTPVQWTGQRDAGQKVVYTTIKAWLMPDNWSQDQIDAWISKQ